MERIERLQRTRTGWRLVSLSALAVLLTLRATDHAFAQQPTGLPGTRTFDMELTRVHYEIEKVTGTNFSGQPRDSALEKKGDLKSITGSIPVTYSATWATGFGNLNGQIDFGFPATLEVTRQANGRYTARGRVLIKARADWSNKGLGFGRPTGIWIRGDQDLARDDKGSLANGSTSANAIWQGQYEFLVAGNAPQGTGEWVLARVTVSMRGLQNRNTTLTAIYKVAGTRTPALPPNGPSEDSAPPADNPQPDRSPAGGNPQPDRPPPTARPQQEETGLLRHLVLGGRRRFREGYEAATDPQAGVLERTAGVLSITGGIAELIFLGLGVAALTKLGAWGVSRVAARVMARAATPLLTETAAQVAARELPQLSQKLAIEAADLLKGTGRAVREIPIARMEVALRRHMRPLVQRLVDAGLPRTVEQAIATIESHTPLTPELKSFLAEILQHHI